MNGRILELIKNPATVREDDAGLLTAEIAKHPYCQSLRALLLLNIHRYKTEDYAAQLSLTAAYTTDKKILYQFINGPDTESAVLFVEDTPTAGEVPAVSTAHLSPVEVEFPAPVYINGELNRILFPGEENFLEEESQKIDLESSLESGKMVMEAANLVRDKEAMKDLEEPVNVGHEYSSEAQNEISDTENLHQIPEENNISTTDEAEDGNDFKQNVAEKTFQSETASPSPGIKQPQFSESPDAENFTKEKVVSEDNADPAQDHTEKSFHEVEAFLPDVTVEPSAEINAPENAAKPDFQETAEAESFSKEQVTAEPANATDSEEVKSAEISFHGIQEFLPKVSVPAVNTEERMPAPKKAVTKQEEEMQKLIAEVEAKVKALKKDRDIKDEPAANQEISFAETQAFQALPKEETHAKAEPLKQITASKADVSAATEKHAHFESSENSWKPMQIEANQPDALLKKGDAPNQPKVPKAAEDDQPIDLPDTEVPESSQPSDRPEAEISSNIPHFFNTWQAWLKIDRAEPEASEESRPDKEAVKSAAIEKFIEKEPKISKLKDEPDFTPRDRGSNISHLMTETLAQIYLDQRLYAMAISAYETLAKKHPDRKKYFKAKVQEVKDLRRNPQGNTEA